jgi:hypothetical protein
MAWGRSRVAEAASRAHTIAQGVGREKRLRRVHLESIQGSPLRRMACNGDAACGPRQACYDGQCRCDVRLYVTGPDCRAPSAVSCRVETLSVLCAIPSPSPLVLSVLQESRDNHDDAPPPILMLRWSHDPAPCRGASF